jgi:hypothetical protein
MFRRDSLTVNSDSRQTRRFHTRLLVHIPSERRGLPRTAGVLNAAVNLVGAENSTAALTWCYVSTSIDIGDSPEHVQKRAAELERVHPQTVPSMRP